MNSISSECQELKEKYDNCFNKWFKEKFLKGSTHDACHELFKKYQKCIMKGIKEHGIDETELKKHTLNGDANDSKT